MKLIPLTQGQAAIVDDDDYGWLSRFKWSAQKTNAPNAHFYAVRHHCVNGKMERIYMHREILGITDSSLHCDHINGITLDNRRTNLRPCNRAQNQWNRKKLSNNTSGYKGVYKSDKKFTAAIRQNGKRYHLGRFKTIEEAASAYDAASRRLHGDFAKPNQ
jgi:hypothetical protein